MTNRRKIINDPVYGFISIPNDLIYDLVGHPWFQRLRNIRQLGLSSLVYPGAVHSRFQHCLGAMYLTGQAVQTLRSKGTEISAAEEEAVLAAILLHDIGHGPFSHALEHSLIEDMPHETMSLLIMEELNKAVGGSSASQHVKGEAVDFHVSGHSVYDLAIWISNTLDYDQLILENFLPGIPTSGWVHCSFARNNRGQDLTKFKGSKMYHPGIILKPE